tara:strand:+ start:699 stop:2543 length:1845 start_codon:yes stop_codon:yes gene_type:complete
MNKYLLILVSTILLLLFTARVVTAEGDDSLRNELLRNLPADQREAVLMKINQAESLEEELESTFDEIQTQQGKENILRRAREKEMTEAEKKAYAIKSKDWIFGYDIFSTSPTTFAPATDIPVPNDYVLGPGDQVQIEVYGDKNFRAKSYITRNGQAVFPQLGPITLAGLSLEAAKDTIDKKVTSSLLGSEVYVSLGELRSISIYILGAAFKPGSYTISSLSTLTNALFVSGGVNTNGSLRNIQVKRNGETVSTFDFYKLLLEGDTSSDVRLQQGDTIFIPTFESTARVMGEFKRNGLFEIIKEDTLSDLIKFAGGLKPGKGTLSEIELNSIEGDTRKRIKLNLEEDNYLDYKIKDGDNLAARSSSLDEVGYIELSGQFKYPGMYTVNRGETLSQVMARAGGLTDQAYLHGAIFTRESVAKQQKVSAERSADYLEQSIADTIMSGTIQNLTAGSLGPVSELIKKLRDLTPVGRIVVDVNPVRLKSDPAADFEIKDGDRLVIPKRPTSITIVGEVISPNSISFRTGVSYEDYIKNAGGFKNSADTGGVFAIMPNGEVKELNKKLLFKANRSNLIPGTTIVVPRDPEPFNWLVLTKTITPILADTATAIATVEALLD